MCENPGCLLQIGILQNNAKGKRLAHKQAQKLWLALMCENTGCFVQTGILQNNAKEERLAQKQAQISVISLIV